MKNRWLAGAALAMCAVTLTGPARAAVAEQQRTFSIPAGSLQSGLDLYVHESGRQLIYREDEVRDARSAGVRGIFSPEDALKTLLAGSGFVARTDSSGAIAVVSAVGNESTGAPPADSQPPASADAEKEILVTARRQKETRDFRLNNIQLVDGAGRTAIEDNPIHSVSDLLRRLPGVGTDSDHGDTAGELTIRGLGFLETTLDGHEIADPTGRSLDLRRINAEIVDSVLVYKTISANMIDGGLAALIDIRTRQPLSYTGLHLNGSTSGSYDDGTKKFVPGGTVAVGDSWNTSAGKFGIIFGVGADRSAAETVGPWVGGYEATTQLFDVNHSGQVGDTGDTAVVPAGFVLGAATTQALTRQRYSESVQLEWQPSDSLDLHAALYGFQYDVAVYSDFPYVTWNDVTSPAYIDRFTLLPGTNIVSSGFFANGVTDYSAGGSESDRTRDVQATWGGTFRSGPLKISADGDYTKGVYHILAQETDITASDSFARFVLGRGNRIDVQFGTIDPTNLRDWTGGFVIDYWNNWYSTKWAGRLDAEYDFTGSPIKALQVGFRYARLAADQTASIIGFTPLAGPDLTPYASSFQLFTGQPGAIGDFLAEKQITDIAGAAWRTALGLPGSPPPADPGQAFSRVEKTSAAYARAIFDFKLGGIGFDGDAGVRVVRTDTLARGAILDTTTGTSIPVTDTGHYTNVLPSGNLRAKLTDKLNLRVSGSDTVTRPNFSDLSPVIQVGVGGLATAGNPELKAFTSRGFDAGIEWYPSTSGYYFVTLFTKHLDNFIENKTTTESIGGRPLLVSRPFNASTGHVSGVEAGLSQRFTFLPGVLSGFGVDVNATLLRGSFENNGQQVGLAGTAYRFLNAALYFEHARFSTRMTLYARSRMFLDGTKSNFAYPATQVDWSARYKITPHIEALFNVLNVFNADDISGAWDGAYFGGIFPGVLPHNISPGNRHYEAGVRVKF
jgi:TonB-dependent receptor